MKPGMVPRGDPVILAGSPYERGRQQADQCPDMVTAVRQIVLRRLEDAGCHLASPRVRSYLDDLHQFHTTHDPEIIKEASGVSDGFGIQAERLLDYLMLSLVEDLNNTCDESGECTAFAASAHNGGVILAKNRDYRQEHIAIQRVFHHQDPGWNGREVLCVGSLGSPGNFSSGMNSDGLAIADTASRTTRHGVGRHRYFLLTRLLVRCATVSDALHEISSTPHAGGGTIILGDASGCMAAAELGACTVNMEIRHEGWVGRTNHFTGTATKWLNRTATGAEGAFRNSERRLMSLHQLLSGDTAEMRNDVAASILSYRGRQYDDALCRMGGRDHPETISGSIYDTRQRCLWFTHGKPSDGEWHEFSFCD